MARALELARQGQALAHPNPAVGAVVVKGDKIVGEGFHEYDRRDHAEVVALKKAGDKTRGATIYTNLEPCCHVGRTGPCTKAIIAAGIRRVVAAMKDPNPVVAGRGFAELREAGIQVAVGVGEAAARRLNEDFACWMRTGRPLVTLKSALTLDGQIAIRAGEPTAISGKASREEVQRLRHASDALLTGIGTVLADDPRLTDRTGLPRHRRLLRVVVDSWLRTPLQSELVKSAREDLVIFTIQPADGAKARALKKAGAEVVRIASGSGRVELRDMIRELGKRQIMSVLLEAGSELNGATLEAGIVDKMVLFYSPRVMGTRAVPFARFSERPSPRLFPKSPALSNLTLRQFGPDFAVEGYFHDVYGSNGTHRKN